VAGRWEGSVVQARVCCVLEAWSLGEHVVGSDEGENKSSSDHRFRRRAPMIESGGPPLMVVACERGCCVRG